MQVEILTKFKHQDMRPEIGDRITVDDQTGAYFCRMGWATDLSGQVATEAPDQTKTVLLDVQPLNNPQQTENVDG